MCRYAGFYKEDRCQHLKEGCTNVKISKDATQKSGFKNTLDGFSNNARWKFVTGEEEMEEELRRKVEILFFHDIFSEII